jgi:CubicO group peptidase (beta-lactamase class C family)
MLSRHVSRSATEKRGVYKYRNAELALCGAILEARAGVPAAQVLAREVFEPAGMTRSGLLVGEAPPAVDLRPLGALRPQNFFTAGAGYASPTDLLAFFEALAGPSLVSDASRKVLFDGAPERGHGAMGCWAYPFGAADAGTTLLVERPGAFGNVRLFSAFFPDERRAIVAWSREPVDIGRPRTPRSIGSALARVVLEADTAPVNPPR